MFTFFAFFRFELRRLVSKRNALIMSLLVFFLFYFLQTGINQFQTTQENNEEFKKIEKLKVGRYINYTQYGTSGIRMLFSPSPLSVFFSNTGVISNMTARADSSYRLEIYNSLKGKNGFVLKSFGFTDFSGIILYFGSLLALLFGYDSFQHRDYLKFLSAMSHHRRVFLYIILSRMILLVLLLAFLMGGSLLVVLLNHLSFNPADFIHFLYFGLVSTVVLLFFFLVGTLTSTMKSKIVGIVTLIIFWFVMVFFIPAAIHAVISSRAEVMTPLYKLEFEKFKQVTDFEKRALEQQGVFNKDNKIPQSERDLAEDFLENEFKKMQLLETAMFGQMKSNISLYQSLSVIFPSTFYFSSTNEISSKGYDSLIDFYHTSQEVKLNFVRYYANEIFYHNNFTKVKSFIKGDENLYRASSRMPGNYRLGFIVVLLYMFLAFYCSYIRYKQVVFSLGEDWKSGLKNPRLFLDKGELRPFYVEDSRFSNQVYNLLSGKHKIFKQHGFEDKIYIDDIDVVMEQHRDAFFYLCRIDRLPGDIRAGALVKLVVKMLDAGARVKSQTPRIQNPDHLPLSHTNLSYASKPLARLTRNEKEDLLLSMLRHQTRPIYLIDDITKSLSINFVIQLKVFMEELSKQQAIVIYLTSDYHPFVKTLRKEETFYEHTTWQDVVSSLDGLTLDDEIEDKEGPPEEKLKPQVGSEKTIQPEERKKESRRTQKEPDDSGEKPSVTPGTQSEKQDS